MELNDFPQMDPRALKATSVKAEDEHASSAEPQALKITAQLEPEDVHAALA